MTTKKKEPQRPRSAELVGKRFGKQVVLRTLPDSKVEVRCDCGTVKATPTQYLRNGQSRSCGCGRYEQRSTTKPMSVGDVFFRLTVVQLLGTNGRKREVLAQCECGTRKVVDESTLRDGITKSCGCFRRERMAVFNHSHGQAGSRRTMLYRAWEAMWARVTRRDRYPTYAKIKVCAEWAEFAPFRDYVDANLGPRPDGHSLDRKDNTKDYKPGNIKWSTPKEQARNRKSNVTLTVDGVTRCLAEWAELAGVSADTIRARLRHGWPEHLAVLPTPKQASIAKSD